MTIGEFTTEDWVERLAQALTELATTQARYRADLDRQRQQRIRMTSDLSRWRCAFDHPSQDLWDFYGYACAGKDRYYIGEYSPLCAALTAVRRVLAEHPAWAGIADPSGDRDEFWLQILSHGGPGSLLKVISGLMARGMEVPQDGFRVAAAELHGLLDPGGDREQMPVPDDLSVGYHIALFHGLRVREEVQLTDTITLRPLEQLAAFVNEDILEDIAPEVIRYGDRQPLGALVQPFRWKPEFQIGPVLRWDGGNPFFEDAEDFVELLALFHATPVICLALLPDCIHRTASYLLGDSPYNRRWSSPPRSFDTFAPSIDLRVDALDEARKAFGERQSANYQDCAPIIVRLAEALARSGRFQTEDQILDVAIALERMYELEGGEISFKLRTRAASFLETSTEGRRRVFRDVKKFYDVRSGIVHKRKKPLAAETIAAAFTKGFAVARRSVVKLLQDGSPEDWDEMVIAETEPGTRKSQGGDGTT